MRKAFILLGMCILLAQIVSGVGEYVPIFFDHFDNGNYASEGWTVGEGGISESGTIIKGTGTTHNYVYIDSDSFGNISLHDEDWRID